MLERIPQLFLIYALDENNVMGKNNELPWRSPHDFRWFRYQTIGWSVIMGRKTWESLPPNSRPLFNRSNYVVTRNPNYVAEGAKTQNTLKDAINSSLLKNKDGAIFVIGGKSLLEEASHLASKAYVSRIGVKTPIDDTCVMAPTLPNYQVEETHNLFDGDERHPSVVAQLLRFT